MVETKTIRVGDKIYIEKTLYCNHCKGEVLKYKKIVFDTKEKDITLEWLENVKCPHLNEINRSLSLDE